VQLSNVVSPGTAMTIGRHRGELRIILNFT
jgi:hypothetical protein